MLGKPVNSGDLVGTYRYVCTQALCLSLLVNAIITWNTVYMELALAEYVRRHGPVSPEILAHLSPALMEHVNQYGT